MGKSSVQVNLLGSSFTVQADGDDLHLRQVVNYLAGKIRELESRFKAHDPLKISLLAGLNIVDELLRCRKRAAADTNTEGVEIERITERLIDTIDRSLLGN